MEIELSNIHKSFGSIHANNDVCLEIPSGTILGILGENGAGKSTLMKILSGYISQDKGEIVIDGQVAQIGSTKDALRYGIGMLHQDPMDFPSLTVLDNYLIGAHGGIFPNRRKVKKTFLSLQNHFGFNIDAEQLVETLTVGERQQLEILRILWKGTKLLILDEPTTGISAQQKELLFSTLRRLREEGKTIIFVSHKLEEVEKLCGQIFVMRKGKIVGEVSPPYKTSELVRLMFGKSINSINPCRSERTSCMLKVRGLCIEDLRLQVKNVNLDVFTGEVIGLAGIEGSGQRRFLQVLSGLKRAASGHLVVNGKDMSRKSLSDYRKARIYFVPTARLEEGLIPGMTFIEHVILSQKKSRFLIDYKCAAKKSQSKINEYNIHGKPFSMVEELSGGNQQRALLALVRSPALLLLLEHPTRGLDVESTNWVWQKLKERCQQQTSIFFTSSDLEEILLYSDRIIVFFNGRVSPFLDTEDLDVEQLGQLIGGKGWEFFSGKAG